MPVLINTRFNPFRLVLRRHEPVVLNIEIVNQTDEEKLLSFELLLTRYLALDRGGIKSGEKKQLGTMQPGEKKAFYYEVFPKQMTRKGAEPIRAKVLEHYRNYNYVTKETKKDMELLIE